MKKLVNGKYVELTQIEMTQKEELSKKLLSEQANIIKEAICPPYWDMMEALAKYFENPLSDSNPFMDKFRAVQREIKAEQERYMNP